MKKLIYAIFLVVLFTRFVSPAYAENPYETKRFYPFDQGRYIQNFRKFRENLEEIVEKKDTKALIPLVDKNIHFSFGKEEGKETFLQTWELKPEKTSPKSERFWYEFGKVIKRGGGFFNPETFEAPYYFAQWPKEYDAFSYATVLGEGVNVYTKKNNSFERLKSITYLILKKDNREIIKHNNHTYVGVIMPDGQKAYISDYYLGNPIGYRAIFKNKNGQWFLSTFIAGD